MINFANNPNWFCGINDFRISLMQSTFRVAIVIQSYRDCPDSKKETNIEWDDYCGMYLMGGEL